MSLNPFAKSRPVDVPSKSAAAIPPRRDDTEQHVNRKPSPQAHRMVFRSKVFSTQVTPEFMASMDVERQKLAEREAKPLHEISRPVFLERMLGLWKEKNGGVVAPYGLSERALRTAELIGNHLKEEDLGQLIEDALGARAVQLGLVQRAKKTS